MAYTLACKDAGVDCPYVARGETEEEVFKFVHDGIQNGAIGINLGRNIWQSPNPAPMARGLQAIIHEKASVKEAQEIFNDMKNS